MSYRPFFGLTREPFSADLETSAILQTDELLAIGQRVEYVIRIGGIPWSPARSAPASPPPCAGRPDSFTPPDIKPCGSPPPPAPSSRSIANCWRNSTSTPSRLPGRSSPGSSASRYRPWSVPKNSNRCSSSTRPPCSGWTSLPNCTPSPSSRAIPNPGCPSSLPGRTISPRTSSIAPPSPWPHASWPGPISRRSTGSAWNSTSTITSPSPA